jgi:hypothetical protein
MNYVLHLMQAVNKLTQNHFYICCYTKTHVAVSTIYLVNIISTLILKVIQRYQRYVLKERLFQK